eukprot:1143903-Pelagomonas_calceolata.AAC.2
MHPPAHGKKDKDPPERRMAIRAWPASLGDALLAPDPVQSAVCRWSLFGRPYKIRSGSEVDPPVPFHREVTTCTNIRLSYCASAGQEENAQGPCRPAQCNEFVAPDNATRRHPCIYICMDASIS